MMIALSPDPAGPDEKPSGICGSPGTASTATSVSSSTYTGTASYSSPSAVTTGSLTPASTCALVITRSRAYTKPEPSICREHDGATPLTCTTEPDTEVTTGLESRAWSGAATSGTSVGVSGSRTSGSPLRSIASRSE